eukprot:1765819-Rhodomonas_salina.2
MSARQRHSAARSVKGERERERKRERERERGAKRCDQMRRKLGRMARISSQQAINRLQQLNSSIPAKRDPPRRSEKGL